MRLSEEDEKLSGSVESLKLQQLRILLAIERAGTFSGAALDLNTSQSTVSTAVAELEGQLGVRLLERGRFGARPTDVGSRVIRHARRLESVLEAIVQEAALSKGDLRGSLRVNAFRSVATHVLPSVVAQLKREYPHVAVSIHESENLPSEMTAPLYDGRVDVAVTTSELAGDAIFWELFRDPYVAVVPNDWRGAAEEGEGLVSLDTLLGEPMILGSSACWIPLRRRVLALQAGFRPAFEISQDSTMMGMVAEGLGVAVMPALAIDALPEGARQVELAEAPERRVGVAVVPSALKAPAVRAFLLALRRRFPKSEIPALGIRAEAAGGSRAGLGRAHGAALVSAEGDGVGAGSGAEGSV